MKNTSAVIPLLLSCLFVSCHPQSDSEPAKVIDSDIETHEKYLDRIKKTLTRKSTDPEFKVHKVEEDGHDTYYLTLVNSSVQSNVNNHDQIVASKKKATGRRIASVQIDDTKETILERLHLVPKGKLLYRWTSKEEVQMISQHHRYEPEWVDAQVNSVSANVYGGGVYFSTTMWDTQNYGKWLVVAETTRDMLVAPFNPLINNQTLFP